MASSTSHSYNRDVLKRQAEAVVAVRRASGLEDPRVCFRKIPREKRARLIHTVARETATWEGRNTNREDRKRRWGMSLTKFIPDLHSISTIELGSPTNLGNSDRPVFFMLLRLPC